MSRPTLVARYKAWFGRLPPKWQITLGWAFAVVCVFLTMSLLRLVGLTDDWAVVVLYTAVYAVGSGILLLLIRRRGGRNSRLIRGDK